MNNKRLRRDLPAKTNLIFNLQFREVRNYPWKIECFLEDLFLGSCEGEDSVLARQKRKVSPLSSNLHPFYIHIDRDFFWSPMPIVNEISVITFGLLLVNLANFFFLAGQQLQKRQKSNGHY